MDYSKVAKKLNVPKVKASEIMSRAVKHGQQAQKKKSQLTKTERR